MTRWAWLIVLPGGLFIVGTALVVRWLLTQYWYPPLTTCEQLRRVIAQKEDAKSDPRNRASVLRSAIEPTRS